MGAALLVCRLMAACAFATAGAAKLADRAGSRRAVVGFGVAERLAELTGVLLPLVELALALALLPVRSAGYGAVGAGVLLVASMAVIGNAMAHGGERSLGWLLALGRRLVLVFSDPGCGPCNSLLPDLATWQRAHAESLTIVVVAGGGPEANRAKAGAHGLARVLLQGEREVSDAYQAYGTPTAVVIGPDGRVESPVVGGSDAIGKLVAQAARSPARRLAASNGRQHSQLRPAPDESRVGQSAPELPLTDLDGRPVTLADLERTLAIFWNPGCGFCQRMLPELKAFEEHRPAEAPRILVISTGDPDAVRARRLGSTVLLDPNAEAMRGFGAGGGGS